LLPWTPSEPEPATDCSGAAVGVPGLGDECACEDLACDAGESCLRVIQPPPPVIGGSSFPRNVCLVPCASDDDCTAPSICVGELHGLTVCKTGGCRNDADCSADACGKCVGGYVSGHAGAVYTDPSAKRCVYPGGCGQSSCQGCTLDEPGWHQCGG
jgi:hypothetical protein